MALALLLSVLCSAPVSAAARAAARAGQAAAAPSAAAAGLAAPHSLSLALPTLGLVHLSAPTDFENLSANLSGGLSAEIQPGLLSASVLSPEAPEDSSALSVKARKTEGRRASAQAPAPAAAQPYAGAAEQRVQTRRTLAALSQEMQGDLNAARPGSGASAEASSSAGRQLFARLLGFSSKNTETSVEPNPGEHRREAEQAAKRLVKALLLHKDDPAAAERAVLQQLAELHSAGRLEATLALLASEPRLAQHLPPMPESQRAAFVKRLGKIIGAELEMSGLVPGATPFEEWEKRADRQLARVQESAFAVRRAGEASLLSEPGFVREMEDLTGDSFLPENSVELQSDGAASYAARNALIAGARKSVHLMAWGLYDDKAGRETVDLLIAKKREGLDVKVIVDGQTVEDSGHGVVELARLSAAGVEVIRFHDAKRKYDGLHAKILVVDGEAAILGGRNVGDPYLHADPAGLKWRDLDVLVRGPAAAAAARRVAEIWNEQVLSRGLPAGMITLSETVPAPAGTMKVAVSYSRPEGEATILLGMLKAMAGATKRVRIENAYFITFPSVRRAILDALARGVEVQILTNSKESIDEPIVAVPILESLPELIAAGAQIFLKQGETLHAKFMTADGLYSNVTSLNVHPRSDRYEHESATAVLDSGFTAALDAEFDADIAQARRIARAEDLAIPRSALTFIIRRYLFNQL